MKLRLGIFLVACLSWTAILGQGRLDQLLARHAAAMGGKANWERVHSMRIVNVDDQGRRSTELIKKPGHYQLIFELAEGQQFIKSYDGKGGWISKTGQMVPMDPGEVVEMAEETDFHAELLFAQDRGHRLKLLDNVQFEGREVNVVALTKGKDDQQLYYLDPVTALVVAVAEYSHDPKWKGTYFQTRFYDYKPVEGLQFSHRWELGIGAERTSHFTTTSIEINPLLSDAVFEMPAQQPLRDVRAVVAAMHSAATRASLMEYTFVQQTIRMDSLGHALAPSTWYEALHYPDLFRIDVGEPSQGRAVIYRNDSAYYFRGGKLARAEVDTMPFLLLEGGLKCYALDEVLARMQTMGYRLDVMHEADFQGKPMYVIGATAGDLRSKQIWVEQARLIPIRRIDPQADGGIMEVVYGDFQLLEGKWVETRVDFWLDGKLIQQETYSQLDGHPQLHPALFIPAQFGQWHWRE